MGRKGKKKGRKGGRTPAPPRPPKKPFVSLWKTVYSEPPKNRTPAELRRYLLEINNPMNGKPEELEELIHTDSDEYSHSESGSDLSDFEVRRAVHNRLKVIEGDEQQSPKGPKMYKECPTVSEDYAKMWRGKKDLAMDIRRWEDEESSDSDRKNKPGYEELMARTKSTQTVPIDPKTRLKKRSKRPIEMADFENMSTTELREKAQIYVDTIRCIASTSRCLTRSCVRDLKNTASSITDIVSNLIRPTETEEISKIAAQYDSLYDDMLALQNKYAQQVRTIKDLESKLAKVEENVCSHTDTVSGSETADPQLIVSEDVQQLCEEVPGSQNLINESEKSNAGPAKRPISPVASTSGPPLKVKKMTR